MKVRINGSPDQILAEMARRLDLADEDVREASLAFALLRVARRDRPLLKRIGSSVVTAGFLAIRNALSRDCISALTRIMDGDAGDNFRLHELIVALRRHDVVAAIVARRMEPFAGDAERAAEHRRLTLRRIAEVQVLYEKLTDRRGARHQVTRALDQLRNDRIGHRRVIARTGEAAQFQARRAKVGDERQLLIWTMNLLQRLRRLVDDLTVDYAADREMHRRVAERFWRRIGADPFAERAPRIRMASAPANC